MQQKGRGHAYTFLVVATTCQCRPESYLGRMHVQCLHSAEVDRCWWATRPDLTCLGVWRRVLASLRHCRDRSPGESDLLRCRQDAHAGGRSPQKKSARNPGWYQPGGLRALVPSHRYCLPL